MLENTSIIYYIDGPNVFLNTHNGILVSDGMMRGLCVKRNCIVLNYPIYEPSLIVHDPLRGTTAIFGSFQKIFSKKSVWIPLQKIFERLCQIRQLFITNKKGEHRLNPRNAYLA